MRGLMHNVNMADHVFYVTVVGDDVTIEVVKSHNGLVPSNDDPQFASLRAAVLRYVDGEAT